ncbi:MAG TPA: ATP-binding protein [Acidobacteriota bacterium]|nr:ATP-binding protein [Acidobacteriota bacterium]
MARFRVFQTLHFKVASGVIATIVLISSLHFIADYRSNRRQLLAELRTSADQLAGIALEGLLEMAMMGQHPELLQHSIERLGANSSVERIFLLDLSAQVRFSSDRADLGLRFTLQEDGCRPCHEGASASSRRSEFMELGGENILRYAAPVPNRTECHACHDPAARYNGVLVMDFPTAPIRDRLRAELGDSFYRASLMVLATLIVLGILMNKLVILPLKRLTRATAALSEVGQSPVEIQDFRKSDEIGQLAASFQDMTGRIKASVETLQSQRAYLQTLVNSLPDGLILVDAMRRVEMTNRAADALWSRSELDELLNSAGPFPQIATALRQTLECGQLVTCEIKLHEGRGHLNGGDAPESGVFEICFSPLRDSQGEIDKAVLLVRNVSERKAFETQASRAERLAAVGRLAAGLAHEINNPMASITTCVEGLSRYVENSSQIESSEKEEIKDYLATVGEAAERCKEITQRLLSASVRHGSGKVESVLLGKVVREALTLVQHQARRSGIEISADCGAPDCLVTGNRRQLSQLVLNLLLNAQEAVSRGGRIKTEVCRRDDFVQLRVADSGCGIPPRDLEHIFDPFFTTKSEGRGTGLGLSIAQWIVRRHQGSIHVSSGAGQGTVFTVLIPATGDQES